MDGTILGKKYNLMNGGGGGGTQVVANPEGEATSDLEKLQVGEEIYEIPQTPPFALKTKKYTGTGTTSIEHDFGAETPKVIFGISVDPSFDNQNKDWHFINCFPWGCKITEVRWCVGSNNAPNATGNGGNHSVAVSYNGNKMTINGRDKGGACNIEDIDYLIWYI